MDLSRITVKPRIRNSHESVDLGLIMAKSWWKPLYLSWFIPAFIFYCILSIIFYEDNWLALLLTWWLKPLWDRAPLYIASRKLFNDDVSVKEIIKALPKIYSTDIFAWLLWRRFSFTRSFDMPVTVLEAQKHSQRRKRLDTLHQGSSNAASWLTVVCVHLEAIVSLGVLGLLMLLIPEEVDINLMNMMIDETFIVDFLTNFLTFLSMTLIAPFYTMAGFSLYINRRIKLEAWDIEIRFRNLADTHARKLNFAAVCFIFISFFSMSTFSNDAYADDVYVNDVNARTSVPLTPKSSKVMIDDILKGEDFHKKKKISGWRLKDMEKEKSDDEVPQWLIFIIELLESLFGDTDDTEESKDYTFANLLEMLLWLILAFSLVYLVYRILKYLEVLSPTGKNKNTEADSVAAPDVLFGLDVRKDSIPVNVIEQTMSLWNKGQHREAIGLLYRSTLSLLIHRFLFEFYHGYTEQECSDIVQQSDNKALKEFVVHITSIWQQIAYAHSIPAEQQIKSLCSQWSEVSNNEK